MAKFDKFLIGFVPGLLIPVLFMWIYLARFYPVEHTGFIEMIKQLYPSVLLGKLLLLSAMPNLALVFAFYKSDSFKLSTGFLIAVMPYFIASIFMM